MKDYTENAPIQSNSMVSEGKEGVIDQNAHRPAMVFSEQYDQQVYELDGKSLEDKLRFSIEFFATHAEKSVKPIPINCCGTKRHYNNESFFYHLYKEHYGSSLQKGIAERWEETGLKDQVTPQIFENSHLCKKCNQFAYKLGNHRCKTQPIQPTVVEQSTQEVKKVVIDQNADKPTAVFSEQHGRMIYDLAGKSPEGQICLSLQFFATHAVRGVKPIPLYCCDTKGYSCNHSFFYHLYKEHYGSSLQKGIAERWEQTGLKDKATPKMFEESNFCKKCNQFVYKMGAHGCYVQSLGSKAIEKNTKELNEVMSKVQMLPLEESLGLSDAVFAEGGFFSWGGGDFYQQLPPKRIEIEPSIFDPAAGNNDVFKTNFLEEVMFDQDFLEMINSSNTDNVKKIFLEDIKEITMPSVSSKYLGKEKILTQKKIASKDSIDRGQNSVTLDLKCLSSLTSSDQSTQRKYIETPLQWCTPGNAAAGYTLDLRYRTSTNNTCELPYLFILAGRGQEARIPDDPNVRIVLVLTESQWQDNELSHVLEEVTRLTNPIDFLIYSSKTPELIDNIGMIMWRRMATLIFAYRMSLKDFMMLDDNIASLQLNPALIHADLTAPIDWSLAYAYFKMRAWNVYLLGMNNVRGRELSFPSKVFFFNGAAVFAAVNNMLNGDISALLPDKAYANLPLEDYYLQYALIHLHQRSQESFSSSYREESYKLHFSKDDVAYVRVFQGKDLASQACRSKGVNAQGWLYAAQQQAADKGNDLEESADDPVQQCKQFVLDRMNQVVTRANQHYEEKKLKYTPEKNISMYFGANNVRDVIYEEDQTFLSEKMIAIFEKMFPHQRAAVLAANAPTANVFPTFKLPTGTGKTLVELYLAMQYYLEGKNVFVIAPLQNLVDQFYQAMVREFTRKDSSRNGDMSNEQSLLPVIKVMSAPNAMNVDIFEISFKKLLEKESKRNYIFIFCLDSYLKFLQKMQDNHLNNDYQMYHGVSDIKQIFDESHCVFKPGKKVDETTKDLIGKFIPNFKKNLLFSATPFKVSKEVKHTYKYKMTEAIAHKTLPPINIKTCDWGSKDEPADERLLETVAKESGEGMVYARNINECNRLADILRQAFPSREIAVIHSQMEELPEKLAKLHMPQPNRIIVSCYMLLMGFNPPNITWIIDTVRRPKPWVVVQVSGRLARMRAERFGNDNKTLYTHEESNLYKLYKQFGTVEGTAVQTEEGLSSSRKEYDKKVAGYFGRFFQWSEPNNVPALVEIAPLEITPAETVRAESLNRNHLLHELPFEETIAAAEEESDLFLDRIYKQFCPNLDVSMNLSEVFK